MELSHKVRARSYAIKASFPGDPVYGTAFDASRAFTVTREETTLSLTGPTVILAGSGATSPSARLLEGARPISTATPAPLHRVRRRRR